MIAVEARDEGLEVCRDVGAKHIIDARDGHESVVRQVKELTAGRGVDVSINVSAHAASATLACAMMRIHGTVVQTSAPEQFSVDILDLIFKDITIKASLFAGRDTSQQMLEAYDKHRLKVEVNLFTGLDKVPDMVHALHSGKMKGKAVCIIDKEAFDKDEATR